jgi:hypothetical protein
VSLTTGAALKALVESLSLGIPAFRGQAPKDQVLPYVTVTEEINLTPDGLEDGGPGTAVETAQVDLWQRWHDQTSGAISENYTLAPSLRKGLHGKRTALIGTAVVYMVRVAGSIRLEDTEADMVRHAITVEVNREL